MKANPLGTVSKFWKSISDKTKLIILGSIAVLFACLFQIICSVSGHAVGNTVGTATGTLQAATVVVPAYQEGKEEGLSAKDMEVSINRIKEVGKLDVLAVNAKMTDVMKDGDKYAALLEIGVDVIFSVDISRANLLFGENVVVIVLPEPEVELSFDSTRTRLMDEWERVILNGSTKDGIDLYINSLKEIKQNAKEHISDYKYLESRAEESAKKQIAEMAQMFAGNNTVVNVRFDETEGGK